MDRSEFSTDDRRAIREELGRILSSPCFRNSAQCREFLRFVVERTLSGQAEALKERTIAVEHFGKSHDADLDRDSTVRVCARNTRKRLAEYYATAAAAGPFRIELPVGSYVPVFRRVMPEAAEETAVPRPDDFAAPPRRWPWRAVMAGFLLVLAAAALALLPRKPPAGVLEKFWQPALSAPGGVEVLIAAPLEPPPPRPPADGEPAAGPRSARASQASAAAEILHFLRVRGTEAQIGDYGRNREEEIQEKAIVIVGASAFRGPHAWRKDCPIQLLTEANPPRFVSGAGREWPSEGQASDASYAAIYRIPAEKPRPFTLLIAGLNARSSEIAARCLVDSGRLAGLLRDAPAGWESARMVLLLELRRESARPVSVLLW